MKNNKEILLAIINKTISDSEQVIKMIKIGDEISAYADQLKIETPLNKFPEVFDFTSLFLIGRLEFAIQLKNIVSAESEVELRYFLKTGLQSIKLFLDNFSTISKKISEFVTLHSVLTKIWKELESDLIDFYSSYLASIDVIAMKSIDNSDLKKHYEVLITLNIDNAETIFIDFITLIEKGFLFAEKSLEVDTNKDLNAEDIEKILMEMKIRIESLISAFKNLN